VLQAPRRAGFSARSLITYACLRLQDTVHRSYLIFFEGL
jgi:hypothetical protein